VAQATLDGGDRIVVDGAGLLSGLAVQTASDTAIAGKHAALLDYVRRHGQARRWARDHLDQFASEWAAEIGVSQGVARVSFQAEWPLLVPIDGSVTQGLQHTADLLLTAGVLHQRLDMAARVDHSFGAAVGA
jgi:sulfonate transport system substrate-binding protein